VCVDNFLQISLAVKIFESILEKGLTILFVPFYVAFFYFGLLFWLYGYVYLLDIIPQQWGKILISLPMAFFVYRAGRGLSVKIDPDLFAGVISIIASILCTIFSIKYSNKFVYTESYIVIYTIFLIAFTTIFVWTTIKHLIDNRHKAEH